MQVEALAAGAMLVSAFVSGILSWLAWRRKGVRGNRCFAALMASLSLYSGTVALELLSPGLPAKILWSKAQYLGNAHLAPLWLLFSARYGGWDVALTPRRLMLLWAVPAVSIALVLTNEWHGLAWPGIRLEPGGLTGMAHYEHGPAVWMLAAYSYLLMFIGTSLLVVVALRAARVYRLQAAVLALAAVLPWTGNMLYMARVMPFQGFDPGAIFFALSGIILGWGALRFHLFRVSPVAHAAVIRHMDEGILVLDEDDVVLEVNPASERLVGLSRQHVGMRITEIMPEAAALPSQGGRMTVLELTRASCPEHGTRWIEASVNVLPGATVGSTCRLVLLRDITEHKNLEAQLLQAQKMESVGRLAGGVAHDFNNMLMAIQAYTELALAQTNPSGEVYRDLQEIEKATQRSADLTRKLLAFGRKQVVCPRVVNVTETVSDALDMLRPLLGERLTLVFHAQPDLGLVRIDPCQIHQVLTNLLVNARDAIAGSGNITVELENVTISSAERLLYPDAEAGRYVVLSVLDTGTGIPEDLLEHIFEPFFTTKKQGEGTGLGLASVYGIAKQNEGFVQVVSRVGSGSRFRVFLPSYREPLSTPFVPKPLEDAGARSYAARTSTALHCDV